MIIIDKIEKKYLFSLTRLVALFFIFAALVPIIFGAVHYAGQLVPQSVAIDKNQIKDIVNPEKAQPEKDSETTASGGSTAVFEKAEDYDPLKGRKLPFSIQKQFSNPENMQVLKSWLDRMPYNEQDTFLKELDEVVQQAEKSNVNVPDAVNRFWAFKNQRLMDRDAKKNGLVFQNYQMLAAIGAGILTIAIFSLVLVLLAIERNTRKV